LQNLDEDARDLPFSAPTTTSIPFIPRERVAANADRWFPSKIIAVGFRILYSPMGTWFPKRVSTTVETLVLLERFQGDGSLVRCDYFRLFPDSPLVESTGYRRKL